jgi:hypothetical protein
MTRRKAVPDRGGPVTALGSNVHIFARPVCSAGRVSGVITLSPECQGLAGVLCLSLGSGLLAGGIVGRVHRDDRRPEVETGAPQVAAPT